MVDSWLHHLLYHLITRRKLKEWREARGISYKRPPMPVKSQDRRTAHVLQPFWATMMEEDEARSLICAVDRSLADCIKLLGEVQFCEGRSSPPPILFILHCNLISMEVMQWLHFVRLGICMDIVWWALYYPRVNVYLKRTSLSTMLEGKSVYTCSKWPNLMAG